MTRSTSPRSTAKRKQPQPLLMSATNATNPNHGGKRTPGPGKRIGRPPTPADARKMHLTARVKKDTANRLYSQLVNNPQLSSLGEVLDDLSARHLPPATHQHPRTNPTP